MLKHESSSRLCERVREALGELREPDPAETDAVAVIKADELLEADPLDASHLIFEELLMIARALREVGRGGDGRGLIRDHAGGRSDHADSAKDREEKGEGAGEEANDLACRQFGAV